MIRVTDRATDVLQETLLAKGVEADQAVRLTSDGKGGLGMDIGRVRPDDEVLRRDQQVVLAVDRQVASHLTGYVLDYQDGSGSNGTSPGFVLGQESQG